VLLTQINAVSAAGVRALLQSKDRFWLLDGASLALREISGVWPVTYDAHWDHAAWDVSGERLAITHLNSRSPKDGSTLYIIEDGQVTHSHKLEMASQQSAPMVEWLNDQELLLHSQGSILRIDIGLSPQVQVDVIKEVFDLSLHYPDEIHAWTSHTVRDGSGYYLAVWVNKGRNQRLYFYQSSSGQVSVYQPGTQTLLLFPAGQGEFLSARANQKWSHFFHPAVMTRLPSKGRGERARSARLPVLAGGAAPWSGAAAAVFIQRRIAGWPAGWRDDAILGNRRDGYLSQLAALTRWGGGPICRARQRRVRDPRQSIGRTGEKHSLSLAGVDTTAALAAGGSDRPVFLLSVPGWLRPLSYSASATDWTARRSGSGTL
jgi:hypothetical protein